MNTTAKHGTRGLVGLVLAAVAGLGCSGGGGPEPVTIEGTITQGRLAGLCEVYTLHTDLKRRAPANFGELRAFAEVIPVQFGGPVPLIEDQLVSARDKQPLVVRYGLPLKPNPRRPQNGDGGEGVEVSQGPVVAHEQQGVKGMRFVVYAGTNQVEEVDEAKFKELVP